jgi:N-methylhydantoinase A
MTTCPIYDGPSLGVGAKLEGPAVIEEETTTIVLFPRWQATIDPSGNYLLSFDGA